LSLRCQKFRRAPSSTSRSTGVKMSGS
jgi:hypothetical protein